MRAGCHSFDFHSSRRWMKSKEALGLCISETSSSSRIPFATPENAHPPSDTLLSIPVSPLFYSLSVELHFIIVYIRKLNENSRRCEKFKFYVGSFYLYAGVFLSYRYFRLQWQRLEHLWMNCLLRSNLRAKKKKSLTIWSVRLTTRIIRTLGDHWV